MTTVRVQEYFKNKILDVLGIKDRAVSEKIDPTEVENGCLKRMEQELGIPTSLYDKVNDVIDRKNALKKEESALFEEVAMVAKKHDPENYYWRYHNDDASNAREVLVSLAKKKYKDAVTKELYPAESALLAEIAVMRGQVEAVILLSTTERKLVKNLTAVLEKFGGSIKEVEALLPEIEDFVE